jgi:osmotically inducible lipoprotein OsmB
LSLLWRTYTKLVSRLAWPLRFTDSPATSDIFVHQIAHEYHSKFPDFATIGIDVPGRLQQRKEIIMVSRVAVLTVVAGLLLSGCGTTPGDRGLSGAGIGAAGGAVVGALVGAPLAGAAIGAGAGAVTGMATSPSNVYLGKPAWEQ